VRAESCVAVMKELLAALSMWLSASFGLPEMDRPPEIRFVETHALAAIRYGHAEAAGAGDIVAVYEPLTRTVFLPIRWRRDDVADVSVLVHELVHHLQRQQGALHRCPEEREHLAYEAQARWLGQFGLSLEKAFGIDALSLKIRTSCLW